VAYISSDINYDYVQQNSGVIENVSRGEDTKPQFVFEHLSPSRNNAFVAEIYR